MIIMGTSRRGFSLIEAAIVLGIVGLVIGGIWVAASAISHRQKDNDFRILYGQTLDLAQRYKRLGGMPNLVPQLARRGAPAAFRLNASSARLVGNDLEFGASSGSDYILLFINFGPPSAPAPRPQNCITVSKLLVEQKFNLQLGPGANYVWWVDNSGSPVHQWDPAQDPPPSLSAYSGYCSTTAGFEVMHYFF